MMITEERLERIKKAALESLAARAKNKNAPGVSLVLVTPHEALAFVEAYHEKVKRDGQPE